LQTYANQTSDGPSTAQDTSTTDRAKEQAQQAAGQAKNTLRTQVDQRSTDAGQKVGGFASDVRSIGQQLREQGKDQPAKLTDQAADRAERLGNYLSESDADRILGDVEDFGRRRPWALIAGGAALGFAASRFLKASSSRRYEQRSSISNGLPARTSDVPRTTPVPRTAPPIGTTTTTPPGAPPTLEGSI